MHKPCFIDAFLSLRSLSHLHFYEKSVAQHQQQFSGAKTHLSTRNRKISIFRSSPIGKHNAPCAKFNYIWREADAAEFNYSLRCRGYIKVRYSMWGLLESGFLFGAAIAFCAECIMGSRNFRLTHSTPLSDSQLFRQRAESLAPRSKTSRDLKRLFCCNYLLSK